MNMEDLTKLDRLQLEQYAKELFENIEHRREYHSFVNDSHKNHTQRLHEEISELRRDIHRHVDDILKMMYMINVISKSIDDVLIKKLLLNIIIDYQTRYEVELYHE